MPHDNCDECSTDYTFDPQTDIAVIYLTSAYHNHVQVTCPNCQSKATIFLEPVTLLTILGEVTLPLRLRSEVPDEVRQMRHQLDDPDPDPDGPTHPAAPALAAVPETADLPEAPREWVQQMLDDLRRFGEGEAA
jgi:hypothetical protein